MNVTNCRSAEGITTGLIDTIINSSYLLSKRSLTGASTKDALQDMRTCRELRELMRTYELNELEIWQENCEGLEKENKRLHMDLWELGQRGYTL